MPLKLDDEVQYTNAFLYSTGQAPVGSACFYVGTVVEVVDELFVRVRWNHEPNRPQLVRASNVARRGSVRALEIPSWVGSRAQESGRRKR